MTYRITRDTRTWYVTVVHTLSARLRSLIGAVVPADNAITTKTQAAFLTQAQGLGLGTPAAIVNMAFFGATGTRAGIAFGLKVSSPSYLGLGYDACCDRRILGWNSARRASIWDSPNGANQFDPLGYSNAVGGLSVTDCKDCNVAKGRTFAGVRGDHLLIFSAKKATRAEATAELDRWLPGAKIQFDGGGSSFLTVNGRHLVETDGRSVPHAFAVFP